MLKVCDVQEFIKRARSMDEIMCYGAGHDLADFVELIQDTDILCKCRYVADRDRNKQGKVLRFGSLSLTVIAPESMKERKGTSTGIVITCRCFEEIVSFLEKDDVLKELDFYCLYYLKLFERERKALEKKVPSSFKIYEHAVIPKIIHYCWFGFNPIPDSHKRCMESWHKFCPDYEIKEWNENNYDISKNTYMKQAYDSKKWGFVPDYARLDIIYQYGGIYLDTDVELIANIDDLLYQDGFIGFESEKWINFGMGFGAVQGLEIMKELRDDYEDRNLLKEDGSLNLMTSPKIQTSFLQKRGLVTNGEYQMVEGLTVYPEKVLGGKSSITRKVDILPYTKSIHHFDGSWLEEDVKFQVRKLEEAILLTENST